MKTIPFADYCAIKAEHWTGLKEMQRSPLHYKYRKDNERVDTKAFARGRAGHTAVLEPRRFLLDYAVWDKKNDEGKVKQRRGKEFDSFAAMCGSKTILTVEEYETALAIGDAVRAHPVAAEVLKGAKHEQSIAWTDEATGLPCKSRIDAIGGWLADLKTTSKGVDPRVFGNAAAKYGYVPQLAMYSDGWLAVTGERPPVCIVAVEAEPPYDVAVFEIDEDKLYMGQQIYRGLLEQVAICRQANAWPGRCPESVPLELPAWVYEEDEQEMTATVVEENVDA